MDYTTLSIEELQAKRLELHQQIADLNEELSQVAKTYDVKVKDQELAAKVNNMSSEEKAAMQKLLAQSTPTDQVVTPSGIESELEVPAL